MMEQPSYDSVDMASLEERVFGARIPKARPATRKSKGGGGEPREKRGGRNVEEYLNPSTPVMMGAVDNILDRTGARTEREEEEAVDDLSLIHI